jgi:hypothetical protein
MLRRTVTALLLFSAAALSAQVAPPAHPRSNPAAAQSVWPSGYGYSLYLTGATYHARNNSTGRIDYSGPDAGAVIRDTIAALSGKCGHLNFEPAIYNINSLAREKAAGFSNYYGIRIPGSASRRQYCEWTLEGDSPPPLIDQFGTGVQTSGVIFYLTPAAIATVPASAQVIGIWVEPPAPTAAYTPSASVSFHNIDVRFPTNQRGNETGIDASQALNASYDNVSADFNMAQNSLQFPVAGSIGLVGLTTTASSHEENYMRNALAIGYDIGLDVQSEHSVLINSYAVDGNYCIDYGVHGGAIYHASAWVSSGWGECAHGLTLGPNLKPGTMLEISGLDIEDASPGYMKIFKPVYHVKETNAGYTHGVFEYSVTQGNVGTIVFPNLFDGGGGNNISTNSGAGFFLKGVADITGSAAVTFALQAAAGAGASAACSSGYNCTASSGTLHLLTGTAPSTGPLLRVIDAGSNRINNSSCTWQGLDAATQALELYSNGSDTAAVASVQSAHSPSAQTDYTLSYLCGN